jgi:hypothetical protein
MGFAAADAILRGLDGPGSRAFRELAESVGRTGRPRERRRDFQRKRLAFRYSHALPGIR